MFRKIANWIDSFAYWAFGYVSKSRRASFEAQRRFFESRVHDRALLIYSKPDVTGDLDYLEDE